MTGRRSAVLEHEKSKPSCSSVSEEKKYTIKERPARGLKFTKTFTLQKKNTDDIPRNINKGKEQLGAFRTGRKK